VAQAVHLPLLDRLSNWFAIAAIADLSTGLLEGRVDIVTSQRIVARRAAQLGLPIDGEAAR
jgi:hypothetical protein